MAIGARSQIVLDSETGFFYGNTAFEALRLLNTSAELILSVASHARVVEESKGERALVFMRPGLSDSP